MSKVIDIRPLKGFARKHLEGYPIVRELILSDNDRLPVEEFVMKVKIWLRLLEAEKDLSLNFNKVKC